MKKTLHSDPDRLIVAATPWRSNALAQPVDQRVGRALETGVRVGRAREIERGDPGGDRDRVPAQRAGLIDRADRRELLHQVAPSAERRAREPAAHHLAEHGEVGRDAEHRLRAAVRDAGTR